MSSLQNTDPDVFKFINCEYDRQNSQLELIASENIVSSAILEAQGSIFTNKYAEGYPKKGIMAGAIMQMRLRLLPLIGPKRFLVPNMQMFSLIPVPRPIWLSTLRL